MSDYSKVAEIFLLLVFLLYFFIYLVSRGFQILSLSLSHTNYMYFPENRYSCCKKSNQKGKLISSRDPYAYLEADTQEYRL